MDGASSETVSNNSASCLRSPTGRPHRCKQAIKKEARGGVTEKNCVDRTVTLHDTEDENEPVTTAYLSPSQSAIFGTGGSEKMGRIAEIGACPSPRKRKSSSSAERQCKTFLLNTETGEVVLPSSMGDSRILVRDQGPPKGKDLLAVAANSSSSPYENVQSVRRSPRLGARKLDGPAPVPRNGSGEKTPPNGSTPSKKSSAPYPVAGFMNLATRSSHSLVPPVSDLQPAQTPAGSLNNCFPGSDGTWYQIIPLSSQQSLDADVPTTATCATIHTTTTAISASSQQPKPIDSLQTKPTINTTTANSTDGQKPSDIACFRLPPTFSVAATAPSSAPNTTTSTNNNKHSGVAEASHPSAVQVPESLFNFLQQYASGTGRREQQGSITAIQLPLTLPSAPPAPAPSSLGQSQAQAASRYIYTSNPRNGQLVIFSSMPDFATGTPVSQSQPQEVLQSQQAEHGGPVWTSPITVQSIPVTTGTTSTTILTPNNGLLGKQAPKTASAVNVSKLLQGVLIKPGGQSEENLPPVAAAQDLLALSSPAPSSRSATCTSAPPLLFQSSPDTPSEEPVRENHNMKERRRRARIKDACDLMRQLVPGMSEKTDKATVFEFSARYIHFLKNFVGTHHDKDFLIKYSPY